MDYVRYEGDLSMLCNRIGLLVGYSDGRDQALPLFHGKKLNMVIYGEGPEWETPEYVGDAIYQGKNKSLIVLGPAESELPDMKYPTQLLQEKFPEIPFYFIPQAPVYKVY